MSEDLHSSQPGVRPGKTSALLAVWALVIFGIYFSIMLAQVLRGRLGQALWILGVAAAINACAPSPQSYESLKQRHIAASGGQAALEGLRVIERSGTFTLHGSPEAQGTYHTCLKYPDQVVVDIDAADVQIHQVLGDNGALECDASFKQCSPAPPEVAEELKITARIANREELEDGRPTGSHVELIYEGKTAVGFKYEKEGQLVEVEFTPETGLERLVRNGAKERRYADWKDAGGVLIPMRIEDFEDGQKTVTVVLASARHIGQPSQWCRSRFGATRNQAAER